MEEVRLPVPCLVVLVGPSGSGKSHWAERNFAANEIVSSDSLRAVVGESEHDQRAGADAFSVLDTVVGMRLKRGLVTVIDTIGLDAGNRADWIAAAARHDIPCYAVAFDTPASDCKARNRDRERPVPAKVLSSQLRRWQETKPLLESEGFAAVVEPGPVRLIPRAFVGAAGAASRQRDQPLPLRFDLQIDGFSFAEREDLGAALRQIAVAAEESGFGGIWVMDHFRQIPQVGREWDPMLESYTTVAHLAAVTRRVRLGVLVSGVTYRNPAHLGRIVATLDVLSGGRAICGLGAAWFEKEHTAYGWDFPEAGARLDLLEDTLQLLPLLWGPGSPAFSGKAISVPEAMGYPRPIQDPIPILVGGGGERRTLRLVARYAQACNLFGDAKRVSHKLDVLRRHCAEVGRDFDEIEVTHLGPALVGDDAGDLAHRLEDRGGRRAAARVNAGTVDDHVGRFRELAEAGVHTAIVTLPDLADPETVRRFEPIIGAFSRPTSAPPRGGGG